MSLPTGHFLVVANRDDQDPVASSWDDLRPCVESIHAHGGGRPTTLGWSGPVEPDDLPGSVTAVELPPHLSDWQARRWLAEETQVESELLLLVGDGVVITPTSVDALLADVGELDGAGTRWGVVAATCDTSTGPQRGPVDQATGRTAVDRLEVTLAALRRCDLLDVDPPRCDVAGDTMVAVELRRGGAQSFVSTSYVHRPDRGLPALWHADGSVDHEVVERLMHFRPDLLDPLPSGRHGPAPTRAMEVEQPSAAHAAWIDAAPGVERSLGLARTLGRIHRHREAVEALWEVDLDALADEDFSAVADLLRLNGQLLAERSLRSTRPHLFGPELRELDELIALAGERSLPPQWAAAEA